jgi:hypothetical protein
MLIYHCKENLFPYVLAIIFPASVYQTWIRSCLVCRHYPCQRIANYLSSTNSVNPSYVFLRLLFPFLIPLPFVFPLIELFIFYLLFFSKFCTIQESHQLSNIIQTIILIKIIFIICLPYCGLETNFSFYSVNHETMLTRA